MHEVYFTKLCNQRRERNYSLVFLKVLKSTTKKQVRKDALLRTIDFLLFFKINFLMSSSELFEVKLVTKILRVINLMLRGKLIASVDYRRMILVGKNAINGKFCS